MSCLRAGGLVACVAALAAGGCRRSGPPARERGDAAAIRLVEPDGAPLVGPVVSEPLVPGAGPEARMTACWVALRRPQQAAIPALESLAMNVRRVKVRAGDRDQALKAARLEVCRQDGIPKDRCTDDLFNPDYEGCEGDRREHRRPSPETAQIVDRIRAGLDAGPPPADAGPPAPPGPTAAAPDAGAADAADAGYVLY